ncbi:MAG: MMPL family transporter, partial [Alphaproteobacteria bacterium]
MLACIAAGVVSAAGAPSLSFTNDSRVFFSLDNPERAALERLERTFDVAQTAVLALAPKGGIKAGSEDGALSAPALEALADAVRLARGLPDIAAIDSPLSTALPRWTAGRLELLPLLGADGVLDSEAARRIRVEPLFRDWLISRDGNVAAISLNLALPPGDSAAVDRSVAGIKAMMRRLEAAHPAFEFYLTGPVVGGATFGEATKADLKTIMPGMAALVLLLLILLLRTWGGVIGTLAVIIAATLTAMGIAGWAGFVLNPGSAAAPSIILTLAIADSVHLVSGARHAMARGLDKHAAIAESLRLNLWPVFLTSATTAAGFLSMNASVSPPLRDLGNITAIGVTAAFVYSVTLLPALLTLLPLGRKGHAGIEQKIMAALGAGIVRHRWPLFAAMTVAALGLGAGISQIDLDDRFAEYLDSRYEFRRDTDFVAAHLTGVDVIEHALHAGGPGRVIDADYLRALDGLGQWYRAQPGVMYVASLAEMAKRLNQARHGEDAAFYLLPQAGAGALLVEYARAAPEDAAKGLVDASFTVSRLSVILRGMSSRQLREVAAGADDWLARNAPQFAAPATGLSLMYAHVSGRNIEGMLISTGVALLLISALLVFALRSPLMGVLSLLPNLAPEVIALGLWGWAVGELGLAGSVVTAMTLGIVVDNTIHFLSKYLRARRKLNKQAPEAVCHAFEAVG